MFIREMKTKTTRYQDTSTKTAKITHNVSSNAECRQRRRTSRALMHKGAATVENGSESHTVKQVLATLTDTCQRNNITDLYTDVHSSLSRAAKSQKHSNTQAFRWTHRLQNFQTMEPFNNKNELWIYARTWIICKASAMRKNPDTQV